MVLKKLDSLILHYVYMKRNCIHMPISVYLSIYLCLCLLNILSIELELMADFLVHPDYLDDHAELLSGRLADIHLHEARRQRVVLDLEVCQVRTLLLG